MAGGMDLGHSSRGGKKPLDATINLVPFIDLMAVTISFLIMTAVWTQLGRLQVSSGRTGPTVEQTETTQVATLLLTYREMRLSAGDLSFPPISWVRDSKQHAPLSLLGTKLRELKSQLPNLAEVVLNVEDSVSYEDLVRVIDECVGQGLTRVSVAGVSG